MVVAGGAAGSDAAVPASGTYNDTGALRSYNCAGGGTSHFPDVATIDAHCRHVNYLWARGMIDGFGDGTFKPALNVTRGQMANFVTKGFGLALYHEMRFVCSHDRPRCGIRTVHSRWQSFTRLEARTEELQRNVGLEARYDRDSRCGATPPAPQAMKRPCRSEADYSPATSNGVSVARSPRRIPP